MAEICGDVKEQPPMPNGKPIVRTPWADHERDLTWAP